MSKKMNNALASHSGFVGSQKHMKAINLTNCATFYSFINHKTYTYNLVEKQKACL